MATATRTDIYTRITDRIVNQLEEGHRPWLKPWNAENAAGRITRPLRHNGTPYKGINILMLWASAESQGYSCPFWLTYRQAAEMGGHVKKGEHASPVVYANSFKKKETTDAGDEVEQEIPYLKEYSVFNAEQCEGLPGYSYWEPVRKHFARFAGRSTTSAGTTSFYDSSGSFRGRGTSSGNSTSFYDASGSYSGRADTSGGTTRFYDAQGRFVGSKR